MHRRLVVSVSPIALIPRRAVWLPTQKFALLEERLICTWQVGGESPLQQGLCPKLACPETFRCGRIECFARDYIEQPECRVATAAVRRSIRDRYEQRTPPRRKTGRYEDFRRPRDRNGERAQRDRPRRCRRRCALFRWLSIVAASQPRGASSRSSTDRIVAGLACA